MTLAELMVYVERGVGMKVTDEAATKVLSLMANEIGDKVFDGINWALILKTNGAAINEYEAVRQQLKDMGYTHGEVLRAYVAPNGLIYDIDAQVVKMLVRKLMEGNEQFDVCNELIDTAYETRRNQELSKLHLYLLKSFKAGKTKVSLALYNMNKGNRITYTTTVETGQYANKKVEITLPAFALRHWDLESLNRDYLIPSRIKIQKVQLMEILPSKTGVGFNFEIIGLEE